MWYHGGDLENGVPRAGPLYVTNNLELAKGEARFHATGRHPKGRVFRLRDEYARLVIDHPDEEKVGKVIEQSALRECGGALAVFEEVFFEDV